MSPASLMEFITVTALFAVVGLVPLQSTAEMPTLLPRSNSASPPIIDDKGELGGDNSSEGALEAMTLAHDNSEWSSSVIFADPFFRFVIFWHGCGRTSLTMATASSIMSRHSSHRCFVKVTFSARNLTRPTSCTCDAFNLITLLRAAANMSSVSLSANFLMPGVFFILTNASRASSARTSERASRILTDSTCNLTAASLRSSAL
mmetsp:Transcript_4875/g.7874  ORF Transcript_4875/g.7874 Transcript_4875/m.7874 type:complete len:204 (-) Transcript_4875:253-864(-)